MSFVPNETTTRAGSSRSRRTRRISRSGRPSQLISAPLIPTESTRIPGRPLRRSTPRTRTAPPHASRTTSERGRVAAGLRFDERHDGSAPQDRPVDARARRGRTVDGFADVPGEGRHVVDRRRTGTLPRRAREPSPRPRRKTPRAGRSLRRGGRALLPRARRGGRRSRAPVRSSRTRRPRGFSPGRGGSKRQGFPGMTSPGPASPNLAWRRRRACPVRRSAATCESPSQRTRTCRVSPLSSVPSRSKKGARAAGLSKAAGPPGRRPGRGSRPRTAGPAPAPRRRPSAAMEATLRPLRPAGRGFTRSV